MTIETPEVVIDLPRLQANIDRMAAHTAGAGSIGQRGARREGGDGRYRPPLTPRAGASRGH